MLKISTRKKARVLYSPILDPNSSDKDFIALKAELDKTTDRQKAMRLVASLWYYLLWKRYSASDRKDALVEIPEAIAKRLGIKFPKTAMQVRGITGKAEETDFLRRVGTSLYGIEGFGDIPQALLDRAREEEEQRERTRLYNDIIAKVASLSKPKPQSPIERLQQKERLIEGLEEWIPDIRRRVEGGKVIICQESQNEPVAVTAQALRMKSAIKTASKK